MKIVCFGDSNTYGYDPRSYFGGRYAEEERWVNILAGTLGCTIVNAGENGREIPRFQWELVEFQRMIAEEMPVDLLIIMLGTNDLLQGNSVMAIVNRMEAFLGQIPLNHANILLLAPPSLKAGEWVASRELVDASDKLNKAYMSLAARLGVRFEDTGKWNLSIAFDGVHLTQEGHRAFAEHLRQYLGGMA